MSTKWSEGMNWGIWSKAKSQDMSKRTKKLATMLKVLAIKKIFERLNTFKIFVYRMKMMNFDIFSLDNNVMRRANID